MCSCCPGKVFAGVLRAAAAPLLPLAAGESQKGAVQGGGTEFAVMTRRLFWTWAQRRNLSAAVFFADIRKAFYSRLVEEVAGPLLLGVERRRVFENLGVV